MRPKFLLTCLVLGTLCDTFVTPYPMNFDYNDTTTGSNLARGASVTPYFVQPVFTTWSAIEPPSWLTIKDNVHALLLRDARNALDLPEGAIMDYTSEHSYPAHNGKEVYNPIEFKVNGEGCKAKWSIKALRKAVCEVQADPKAPRKRVIIKDAGGNVIFSQGKLTWKGKSEITMGF